MWADSTNGLSAKNADSILCGSTDTVSAASADGVWDNGADSVLLTIYALRPFIWHVNDQNLSKKNFLNKN